MRNIRLVLKCLCPELYAILLCHACWMVRAIAVRVREDVFTELLLTHILSYLEINSHRDCPQTMPETR